MIGSLATDRVAPCDVVLYYVVLCCVVLCACCETSSMCVLHRAAQGRVVA